jgi:tRNA threonylcarbamoyladenosine biosynthesis protein TsaE
MESATAGPAATTTGPPTNFGPPTNSGPPATNWTGVREWRLADVRATWALGRQLAEELLTPPLTLLLEGDLGAGKTCLVQGLAAGLGIAEPITSPTFALAQHYCGQSDYGQADGGQPDGSQNYCHQSDCHQRTTLVHLDLYRLEQAAAADELFAQEEEIARDLGALLAVEWPQRLSGPPQGAWRLQLQLLDANDPERGRLARLWPPSPPWDDDSQPLAPGP